MRFIKKFKNTQLKRFFIIFCLGILLLQLFQVLYFQREVLLTTYDVSYWKDRVEHSRYVLPLSDRGISDDQFYAYGGYKIIDGQDPTSLVYDKPALGVALVGIFSYYFHNPAFSGLLFGLGILILTYLIVSKITKSAILGLVTTTLLTLDPLFSQNLTIALLDLPQLFFLLLSIYLLLIVEKKKNYILPIAFLSGLMLGVFAQIKIPIMYPLIFALLLYWLFRNHGKLSVIAFVFGNGAALLFGYLPYAVHNYSFIEFIKIQKFVVAFYRDSQLPLHPEAIWQFLFTGTFPGVVDRIPSRVNEWFFLYPVATVLGLFCSVKILLRNKEPYLIKSFALILLVCLAIFTFIPSYPRYIIIILSFLYLFTAKAIFFKGEKNIAFGIGAILLLGALIANFYYYYQSPSYSLKNFYNSFSHQYFQDVYQEHADQKTRDAYQREEFKEQAMAVFADARVKSIEIKEEAYNYSLFDNEVIVPISVIYKTEYLGEFLEEKKITVVRENDKWRVVWKWDYILNEYNLDAKVESTRDVGKRGTIYDATGSILAQDREGYLISILPTQIDGSQEQSMLALFSKLSYISKNSLQDVYLENPPNNKYIPLFTTSNDIPDTTLEKIRLMKGIVVESAPTRIYSKLDPRSITNTAFAECCTRVYSSSNYHGNKKLPSSELQFDKTLSGYDGGALVIRDKNGNIKRTIIEKNKKDGQDIYL